VGKMSLNCIVTLSRNNGIEIEGKLQYGILNSFGKITDDSVVVMNQLTYDSLPLNSVFLLNRGASKTSSVSIL
jgi:dihydrofolate reductase